MKKIYLTLFTSFFFLPAFSVHVAIIESQSFSGQVMDTVWRQNAQILGYTAEILPQTALENISNLQDADVLIVASGTIAWQSADYLTTVVAFIQSGRGAFIQAEYQTIQPGSMQFQSVMDALGMDFSWTIESSGALIPMNVFGPLSTTPNSIDPMQYFHYGLAGEGEDVEPFLEWSGNYYGFICADENGVNGTVITTSDQDWLNQHISDPLVQNMLVMLAQGASHVPSLSHAGTISVFPNPFTEFTTITTTQRFDDASVQIFNSFGQAVLLRENVSGNSIRIDRQGLQRGVYFVRVFNEEMNFVERVVVEN